MYKLSIIIPIYNVELYIEDCLNSLINQIQPEIQVICINDGSPDDSINIAKFLISKCPKSIQKQFLFIDQENQGLSVARNTGLKNALGEYIGFLDSDDKISSEYVKSILKEINTGRFDIIDFNLVTSNGKIQNVRKGNITELDSIFRAGLWYSCTRVFKRSMFDKHEFTPNIYYEDLALTPILYTEAVNTCHINKPLYWYRVNSEGITLNYSLESNQKTIESFEHILNQYIDLYITTNNRYYAYVLMQCYYLLCTSSLLRFNLLESFRIINKHKLLQKNLISKNFLSDRVLKKRISILYRYPYTSITLFKIIHYLKSLTS